MILVFLSGGIDSTGMLIKLLTTTKHRLLVHHCSISGKRKNQEFNAVNNIIKYCKKHYRFFEFSFSEVSIPAITCPISDDMYIWTIIGANIINCDRRITAVARGYSTIYDNFSPNKRKILDLLYSEGLQRKIVQLFPIEGLTKSEVLELIPKQLQQYTWSCRFPKNETTPCKKCRACIEEINARKCLEKKQFYYSQED